MITIVQRENCDQTRSLTDILLLALPYKPNVEWTVPPLTRQRRVTINSNER